MLHDSSFLALKIAKEPKRAALEILFINFEKLGRWCSVVFKSNVFSCDLFDLDIWPLTLTSQQKRNVEKPFASKSSFNAEYSFF